MTAKTMEVATQPTDAQKRVFREIVHLQSCTGDPETLGLLQYYIDLFNNMLSDAVSFDDEYCQAAFISQWFEWAKKDVFEKDEA